MKFISGSVEKLGEAVVLVGITLDEDASGRVQLTGGGGGASVLNDLTDVVITTPGSGEVLRATGSGTDFVNAVLNYSDLTGTPTTLAGYGVTDVPASTLSGTIATARLGSGTADSTTYLRGDQTWQAIAAGAPVAAQYVTLTADGTLTNEFSLGTLSTGMLLSTVSGSVAAITAVNSGNRVPTAYLGSGTASSSSFLRGDQTWQTLGAGVSSLDDLSDVTLTSVTVGQVLRATGTGTNFVNATLAFADVGSKPTTLSGYGITDGVATTRTISTTSPLSGGGDLSANRTFFITTNGISDTLIRQSAALSVIGRSANSTGNVADIAAGTDGHVLRRSGTTLGFGTIPQASVDNLVTDLAGKLNLTGGTLTGNLLFSADDTHSIGAAGATRPASIYAGTQVVIGTDPGGSMPLRTATGMRVGTLGDFDGAGAAPTDRQFLVYDNTSSLWKPRTVQLSFADGDVRGTIVDTETTANYVDDGRSLDGSPANASMAAFTPTVTPIYKGFIIDMSVYTLPGDKLYFLEYRVTAGTWTPVCYTSGTKVVHSGHDLTATYEYRFSSWDGTTSGTPSTVSTGNSPSSVAEINAFGIILASQMSVSQLVAITANAGHLTADQLDVTNSFTANGSLTAFGDSTFRRLQVASTGGGSYGDTVNSVLIENDSLTLKGLYDESDGATTAALLGNHSVAVGTLDNRTALTTPAANSWSNNAPSRSLFMTWQSATALPEITATATGTETGWLPAYNNTYTITGTLSLVTSGINASNGTTAEAEVLLEWNVNGGGWVGGMSDYPDNVIASAELSIWENPTDSDVVSFSRNLYIAGVTTSLGIRLTYRGIVHATKIISGTATVSGSGTNITWKSTGANIYNRRGLYLAADTSRPHITFQPLTSTQPTTGNTVAGELWYDGTGHALKMNMNGSIVTLGAAGGSGYAPEGATYITKTVDTGLSNEFALGSLDDGLLSVATTTGDLTSVNATNRVPTAYLASGTADTTTYLRGDQTWQAIPASGAPVGATYIVQTADGTLTNEFALGSLGSGLLYNTTTSGVLSIATGAAASVLGRSAATTGTLADIASTTDGDVLRRSGTTLGWGAIPQASVTSLVSNLALKANLASPTFSGTVTMPAGGTITAGAAPSADMNTVIIPGFYRVVTPMTNGPAGVGGYGQLIVSRHSDTIFQMYSQYNNNEVWTRAGAPSDVGGAGSWTAWLRLANTDDLALKAPIASPTFTGVPAAPTAAPGTNTTQLATTAFVAALGVLKANLASPTFTGTPAAPTATAGTNTTQVATTAFVRNNFNNAPLGRNLIRNGNAEREAAYNWSTISNFGRANADTTNPVGDYYWETTVNSPGFQWADELIPVDPNASYEWSVWVKQAAFGSGGTNYAGFGCHDKNGTKILPFHVWCANGTTTSDTTLAADVNGGDTTITLTDASGFPDEKTFTPFSYNTYVHLNVQDDGSDLPNFQSYRYGIKTGNVLTMDPTAVPGSGLIAAAGTKVRFSRSSGNYHYMWSSSGASTPTSWTKMTGHTNGLMALGASTSTAYFWTGTKYIKPFFYPLASDATGTNVLRYSDMQFYPAGFDTLYLGTAPVASQGLLRGPKGFGLYTRNFNDTGDLHVLGTNPSTNAIQVGDSASNELYVVSGSIINFWSGGADRWNMQAAGHLVPTATTNTLDLGTTSARLRSAYFDTTLTVGLGQLRTQYTNWISLETTDVGSGAQLFLGNSVDPSAYIYGSPIYFNVAGGASVAYITAAGHLVIGTDPTGTAHLRVGGDVRIGTLGVIDSTVAPTDDQVLTYIDSAGKWQPKTMNVSLVTAGDVVAGNGPNGTAINYFDDARTLAGSPGNPSAAPVLTPIYKGMVIDMSASDISGTTYAYSLEYSTDGATWTGTYGGIVVDRATGGKVVHSDLVAGDTYYYRYRLHGASYSAGYSATVSAATLDVPAINAFGIVIASQISVAKLSAIVSVTDSLTTNTTTVLQSLTSNGTAVLRKAAIYATGTYDTDKQDLRLSTVTVDDQGTGRLGGSLTLRGSITETTGVTTAAVLGNHSVFIGTITPGTAETGWTSNSVSFTASTYFSWNATEPVVAVSPGPTTWSEVAYGRFRVTFDYSLSNTSVVANGWGGSQGIVQMAYDRNGAGYGAWQDIAYPEAMGTTDSDTRTNVVSDFYPGSGTTSLAVKLRYGAQSVYTKLISGTAGAMTGSGVSITWDESSGAAYARRSLYLAAQTSRPHLTLQPLTGTQPTTSNAVEGEMWYDGTAHSLKYINNSAVFELGSNLVTTTSYATNTGVFGAVTLAPVADVRAESAGTAKVVQLSDLHYHPGMAKFWVKFTGNSTTINDSYNMTSITDGTTVATLTIANNFLNASWTVSATAIASSTVTAGNARLATCHSMAAGSIVVYCVSGAATPSLQDPTSWCVVGFGDH